MAAAGTTRRTLHYYWWATRRHLGLYIGMIVSTISFGVFAFTLFDSFHIS